MITGTLELDFILHDCHTLKDKRNIIKSLIEKTRNRFKVAIAEVEALDNCRQGKLGIAVVSVNKQNANSVLDNVLDFIENLHLIDIIDMEMNFF